MTTCTSYKRVQFCTELFVSIASAVVIHFLYSGSNHLSFFWLFFLSSKTKNKKAFSLLYRPICIHERIWCERLRERVFWFIMWIDCCHIARTVL